MTAIRIMQNGKESVLRAEPGENLLGLLRRGGFFIPAACGGNGTCGKCRVMVRTAGEANPSAGGGFQERLACRTQVTDGMEVILEDRSESDILVEGVESLAAEPAAEGTSWQTPSESGRGGFTYAAALDIGTTTVAAALVRTPAGGGSESPAVIARRGGWNRQAAYGADVISRIQFIQESENHSGLAVLTSAIREQTAELLEGLCRDAGVASSCLQALYVAGNTIMQHIFFGISPVSIASAPFTPETLFTDGESPGYRVMAEPFSDEWREKFSLLTLGTTLRNFRNVERDNHTRTGGSTETSGSVGTSVNTVYSDKIKAGDAAGTGGRIEAGDAAGSDGRTVAGDAACTGGIYAAPCAAGYVGGDILSGLAASKMREQEGMSLLLDIGTNGEMAIGGRDGFLCCAVASGPAFEGARISCGMAASPGAISEVSWQDGKLRLSVVGGGKPSGICGSGLIDLLAFLLRQGVVDESGYFLPPEEAAEEGVDPAILPYLEEDEDGNGRFVFYRDDQGDQGGQDAQGNQGSRDGQDAQGGFNSAVRFTAQDVRELQLAKAAIAAGIEVLLQESGVSEDEVRHLYIAGGFGKHLNLASAARIGMFPESLSGKAVYLGNASLLGMEMSCADHAAFAAMQEIQRGCRYLELSGNTAFNDAYIDKMAFEETQE